MTWFLKQSGYELFFNRDEQKSRARALAPKVHNSDGAQYIAPIDADAGGTWIASNQFGVTVCLLNYYQFQQLETYKNWVSRGKIVQYFADCSSVLTAIQRFESMDLQDYRAFRMFVLEKSGVNALLVWDGHQARVEKCVSGPKTSSSVDAKQVKAARKKHFTDLQLLLSQQRQDFIDYHCSHVPARGKHSICMHREDANTVSFSHVVVEDGFTQFRYADGAPCTASLGEAVVLIHADEGKSNLQLSVAQ